MSGHCWHDKGIVLASNPPKYPQVCCHCGASRYQSYTVSYEGGHGPHANPIERRSPTYRYLDDKGNQPCVPEDV